MKPPIQSAASATAQQPPVVLITGASQGIGAAIAQVFASQLPGVRLALVARNAENLAATAHTCSASGATVATFPCDVTDEAAVAALATAVGQRFGIVDVLINNAGVFVAAPFVDTKVADFDRIVAANLRSAFLVTQTFVPAMIAQKHGDVFFMSSIAGLGAYPNSAAYCAAKFGVTGLAQVLRAETRDHGVRVCCVHPGATWSPSWSGSGVAEERIMPAADVAQAFFDVYKLGRRTVVEEIILRPQLGDL
ncbi:MAG: SDR family oxidoreductase [Opitutus sp.]|nr:SDR family oxidoreductase [Opitutus sp.]MCS6248144.1 SDR family oxidoreductase [Opitutus sp.]MCS6275400.1 SDR family oxidoreductase [Opitutus sp.]MCS6277109.1 SDR family oxidoreductase [Opitutus sp.]MCS6300231.1 SDR family oxidoreductase [Opitutus sp.]